MVESLYPPVPRSQSDLRHLPGERGLPVLGQTLSFVFRMDEMPRRLWKRYGPVSRGHVLFEPVVNMLGPDANQFVLADRAGNFSAYGGWEPIIGRLFPRGLMLRDGEDHRAHRRIMQTVFRKDTLAEDLALMQPVIRQHVEAWPEELAFYPAIKSLTLEIAAAIFLGLPLGREAREINAAFVDVVEASMAIIKAPLPGTLLRRGLIGRRRLERFFREHLPAKRAAETPDLFSRLCHARSEDGERFSDAEVVDHLVFVMMAAHDTTTSALSSMAYLLARHPDWQASLYDEMSSVPAPLAHEDLDRFEQTAAVMSEALRLYPPLPAMRRRTLRDCEFEGFHLPADTPINIFNHFTHHMPEYWDEPERFDPTRFQRQEHRRHPFQFIPFGAGAHTCIGLHFAELQVKVVMQALLRQRQLAVEPGYTMPCQISPISKPRDGLPLQLIRRG